MMAEVARWEASVPAEGWRRRWGWLAEVTPLNAAAFGLVVLLIAGIGVVKIVAQHKPWIDAVAPALAPLFVFGCLLKGEAIGRPHRRLRRRLRAVSPRSAHPVRLTLLRDDAPYGGDDGTVSFEEGALVYRGVATSFRLLPSDVRVPEGAFARGTIMGNEDMDWRFGNHDGGSAWGFVLVAHPQVRLYFFPLKARGFASVYAPLYRWLTLPPEAAGKTVLPPLDPKPGYAPPRLLIRKAKAVREG